MPTPLELVRPLSENAKSDMITIVPGAPKDGKHPVNTARLIRCETNFSHVSPPGAFG